MPPVIISIVSKKSSGKTTLIERLVPALKSKGYRVGTIKHDAHGFDIDHEGKDTWRHKQCGAETVVISSPQKIAVIKDVHREMRLDEIVARFLDDMDIVITEGYREENKPRVEVFRKAAHGAPLHNGAGKPLLAVLADTHLDLDVPCLALDDIDRLVDIIEQNLLT